MLAAEGALVHRTRHVPRLACELVDGGSIYWVIAGVMLVRQRILAVGPGQREDGSACAMLTLAPGLVAVAARAVRPFQGWRYLRAEDAPADSCAVAGGEDLPDALRRELSLLALL
jgi:hypothetical protein